MFESVRGGTRGGAAEFKWSDVKADKDRENYLGHSINAPQGRWQNHKDIHWYSRNNSNISDAEAVRREKAREIKEIKMREENELSIALGYGPVHDLDKIGEGKEEAEGNGAKTERELELEKLEAEEKRRRKELKREKRAMKETEKQLRKQEKEERRLDSRSHRRDHGDRERDRSRERRHRSRSPRERSTSPGLGRRREYYAKDGDHGTARLPDNDRRSLREARSRPHYTDSPPRRRRPSPDPSDARRSPSRHVRREEYDFEAERARDRQRWERNHDRERGLNEGTQWGRQERS